MAVRVNPIPCKVCGTLFSNRSYRRYNCDEHYRQKRPEIEMARAQKIAAAKLGTKRPAFSDEWKQKMRDSAQRGSKCHKWRGGVTSEHERIRKSAEYVDWRKKVFERDGYTCVLCGKKGGDLQADHIQQFAYFVDLRLELSNGRTLCKPCHRNTPTYGKSVK